MNELIFRGKDRYRPSKLQFAVLLLIMVIELTASYREMGAVGFGWMLAMTAAILVVGVFVTLRCRTVVGAAGITTCWGFGRGRTHPWHEIRWIDVRETGKGAEKTLSVRITLGDGRRRSLPALQHSSLYPAPDFDVAYRQVVNWWEFSTRPSARFRPPPRKRDRVSPTVAGVLLGLVITLAIGVVVFFSGS
ncbi:MULTISPECIES: PH domain-containing protein [Streptomyces]|uniref:PH domain-containing protein n=1 Tax=Streptomyces TaxID=1883 RepID=UPI00163BCAD7|nr:MULTISPECIES: PH domain-containing protein [Streptomyces]MBC2873912.1 PH domain-containing protein [Streptomyces sp. TYQ1024]UBI39144.1 PH domain-containing protein [Streptomyces mobaraensis]UKW31724.1 PH domain-containing protein [Streptomyces sp. TYQ1024]